MSKAQTLRAFVEQRLTAAAEEIIELFERRIAEYEEELCGQRKLLDAVFQPEIRLHRADVQQLLVSQEEDPPEQQDCLDSVDQEDPPELPHIKEEQKELWTNQEGEQLGGLEEADISKFTLIVPVKSEEEADEEEPQSSQLHQRQTEPMNTGSDGEDCRGPGPDRNFNPDHVQPATHDKTSDSSESETDDSCEWEESREPPSGLKPLQNNEVSGSDMECNSGKTSVSSCATSPGSKEHLQKHNGIQTGEEPFSCSVCGVRFTHSSSLTSHLRVHTGEKPFTCSICEANFSSRSNLSRHVRAHSIVHTGEKPFSCTVCGKKFTRKSYMMGHLTVHTGERPFSCTVCGKGFAQKSHLKEHLTIHTGERPFSCTVCGKGFAQKSHLTEHLTVHTGERPFSCTVCGKGFARKSHLREHLTIHTGERPFSCTVCGKGFARKLHLGEHSAVHTGEKPFNFQNCQNKVGVVGRITHEVTFGTQR
ncbi:zinc finger protein 19-like [Chaetodon trifascialis]|uniref:zinc finger protein 19-like n=1 Tax=Chaetodon trifascialis TaxID=109706 RepID=UPI0039955757